MFEFKPKGGCLNAYSSLLALKVEPRDGQPSRRHEREPWNPVNAIDRHADGSQRWHFEKRKVGQFLGTLL